MKRGKKYLSALEKIEPGKKHTLEEAVAVLRRGGLVARRRPRREQDEHRGHAGRGDEGEDW